MNWQAMMSHLARFNVSDLDPVTNCHQVIGTQSQFCTVSDFDNRHLAVGNAVWECR